MRIYEVTSKPKDTILLMRGCKIAPNKKAARRGKENIDSVLKTAEIASMADEIEADEFGWEKSEGYLPARTRAIRM